MECANELLRYEMAKNAKRNGTTEKTPALARGWRCGVTEEVTRVKRTKRLKEHGNSQHDKATAKSVTDRLARSDPQASITLSGD